MARPQQKIQVFSIQEKRTHSPARPWVVRLRLDGRDRSRSFRTRSEADRYRSQLVGAVAAGEAFDPVTGEPVSWAPAASDITLYAWARKWLAEQWPEWAPRTRRSNVEALTRLLPLAVATNAPPPPAGLRRHLHASLPPQPDEDALDPDAEAWMARWSLGLGSPTKAMLAEVDRQLGVGDKGQQLASQSASRFRKVARACIRRAVDLDVLLADPWPPAPKGRSKRKAVRRSRSVDIRILPDPATMARVLSVIPTHQPASLAYQAMCAVAYYGGLRPSEVVMLRPRALHLPEDGWGRIDVLEADIDFDVPGEPKTGERSVPIPPVLVAMLRRYLDSRDLGPGDLLFRTRTGRRPTPSNWARTWQLALSKSGHPSLRVYDLRHAAATTWLQAGVPLGEVARRLGHSVETLVSTYVGALTGDEQLANDRIEGFLAASQPEPPTVVEESQPQDEPAATSGGETRRRDAA